MVRRDQAKVDAVDLPSAEGSRFNAVDSAQLANGAVGSNQLAPNAVIFGKVAPNAIDPNAIQNDAVNGSKIMDGSLGSPDVAPKGPNGTLAGTFTDDPFTINADACQVEHINSPQVQGITVGDHVVLQLDPSLPDAFDVSPLRITTIGQLDIRICNRGATSIDDTSRTYGFLVIR